MKRTILLILTAIFCLLGISHVYAAQEVVVVIDPGHGGYSEDASAYGAVYKDDLYEKDINLITAKTLKDELEKYNNVEVFLTREDDSKLSLEYRVLRAVELNADVLISCHYNASESHIFYGSEIFTSAFGKCYMTGNALGQCIMEQWVDDGLNSKGIKTRIGSGGEDYYGIIRHGREYGLPVIIIEHGYLDNHIDYERLGTREAWERMGRLDARGIASYYGLSKDEVLDEVMPTVHVGAPEKRVEPDRTNPEAVEFDILDTDTEAGTITYEISASEPDGMLMYYGLALGEPEELKPGDYADLILWEDGKLKIRGTYDIPPGYKGKISARVYNAYELYTDSDSLEIDFKTPLEERVKKLEDEAARAKEKAEKKKEEAAKREEQERIAKEKEEERNALGNFSFLVGGDEKTKENKDTVNRKELYIEIVIAIVLIVVLVSMIIIRHRKKIAKFIKNIDANDWDRY